jgi:CRP/FNR family transcriptional regulator, cyclic AMP receptor protein
MATFNPQNFLNQVGNGNMQRVPRKQALFSQGDTTDAVFYVQAGKVKLTVVSPQGKEAVIAILRARQLFRGRVSRRAAGAVGYGDYRR